MKESAKKRRKAMNKSYNSEPKCGAEDVSEEDMELINSYSRKKLKAEDVFVFSAVLCDNEIDRDFERFSVESLKTLAELFKGKTAIKNHSMNSEDQSARTFKTQLVTDESKKNSLGEPYVYLKAYSYIPRIKKYESLIEEIESGIKKEVSVSCSVGKSICSICGADLRQSACHHKKGKSYKGKLCYLELNDPLDAYEWSFVAVPAQKNAGVIKSFKDKEENTVAQDAVTSIKELDSEIILSREDVKALRDYIVSVETQAQDGREYRKALETETVKLFALTSPEISNDCTKSICKSLSTKDLKELNGALKEKNRELSAPQLVKAKQQSENSLNSQFRF